MDPVFIWHNDTSEDSKQDMIDKIRFFLSTTLKWENTDSLKIIPYAHGSMVEIVNVRNSLRYARITISKSQGKAVLRQKGVDIHEFSVVQHGNLLSVQSKSNRKAIDEIKSPFLDRYEERLISFLTELRTGLIQSTSLYTNRTFDILSRDERYQKALEYLEKQLKFNPRL
jgi:hypothetical protein